LALPCEERRVAEVRVTICDPAPNSDTPQMVNNVLFHVMWGSSKAPVTPVTVILHKLSHSPKVPTSFSSSVPLHFFLLHAIPLLHVLAFCTVPSLQNFQSCSCWKLAPLAGKRIRFGTNRVTISEPTGWNHRRVIQLPLDLHLIHTDIHCVYLILSLFPTAPFRRVSNGRMNIVAAAVIDLY
jgi:hypothetical protein